jgi:hypothetical protein
VGGGGGAAQGGESRCTDTRPYRACTPRIAYQMYGALRESQATHQKRQTRLIAIVASRLVSSPRALRNHDDFRYRLAFLKPQHTHTHSIISAPKFCTRALKMRFKTDLRNVRTFSSEPVPPMVPRRGIVKGD